MKRRILLLNMPSRNYQTGGNEMLVGYNPSFSIMYLGTYLIMNGYDVSAIDLCCDKLGFTELINSIDVDNTLFIGISAHTENINISIKVASMIKTKYPNLNIVFGGAHTSFDYERIISHPAVDFVSIKEGESTLLELAEYLRNPKLIRLDQIKHLVYKIDQNIFVNETRGIITDLDLLPLPMRELFHIDKYTNIINVITSRGCVGKCIYCAANALSDMTYRTESVKRVYLEIVLIKRVFNDKCKLIYFVDDTFTANKKRVYEFTSLYKSYHLDVKWKCQSRIDVMDEDLIRLLSESRCTEILYGIESGSQEVLNEIKKDINLQKALKIIELTYKYKMKVNLSFMIGHYCDTKETMLSTYEFIKEIYEKYMPHPEIALFYNTPYPGTWQYINAEKLGLKIMTDDFDAYTSIQPIVETSAFTCDDQRSVYYDASKYLATNSRLVYQKYKHNSTMIKGQ